MVVRVFFQAGEDKILGYCRNASRSFLDPKPEVQFFTIWDKVKKEIIDKENKIVIAIPIQDKKDWMTNVTSLPDYTHPTDATYIFGASSFGGLDGMLEEHKSELTNADFITIPTKKTVIDGDPTLAGNKPIFGHIACAIVLYDRHLKGD